MKKSAKKLRILGEQEMKQAAAGGDTMTPPGQTDTPPGTTQGPP
jgi:hypothetical protein